MDKIYLGIITSFHGLKGEIKIKSDFSYKEDAFKINNIIIIDDKTYKIKSYRRHKDYEMITLDGYNTIDDVLFLKNKKVYIDKDELSLDKDKHLDTDYIGLNVIYNKKEVGKIIDIYKITFKKKIIVVEYKTREVLVPFELIRNIDFSLGQVEIENVEGLF